MRRCTGNAPWEAAGADSAGEGAGTRPTEPVQEPSPVRGPRRGVDTLGAVPSMATEGDSCGRSLASFPAGLTMTVTVGAALPGVPRLPSCTSPTGCNNLLVYEMERPRA
jgi:hypothetical protein